MKRKHTLIALAALASLGSTAWAQSSSSSFGVNLFGVVDVGLRAVKNGSAGTLKSESSDGLSSSRLGFRGVEDLGDGLKAIFWLEAGLSADTGTANASKFWNRRSTVALSDPRFGEIRLGRDYTPLFTAYGVYDPFGTNGLGSIVGAGTAGGASIISALGSGSQTLTRADNQVSYFLPGNLGGVYGQLAAAASEGVIGGRYEGGRLGWAGSGIDVSVGYEQTRVALDDRFKQMHIGAAYDFGVAKLSGQFLQSKYDSIAGGDRKQRVFQLGATVPVGNGVIRADYIHGDMSGGAVGSGYGDADDANQVTLGYYYNFSKRTAIYADVSQIRNKGASRLIVAAGNAGMKAGENSTGYDFGLRHSF